MTELFYTLGCMFFITTISAQCMLIYTWLRMHYDFESFLNDDDEK